jgi:pimeloyl-ACP methyl ester carboxylesterase
LGLSIRCEESLLQVADEPALRVGVTIHHDADWLDSASMRPVVLFLHGLTGKSEVFDSMREEIRSRGYRTASIGYDSQQPLSVTARQVSEAVAAKLAASSCEPELVLVGHSMGGLIAREWTNNPSLQNASITALITIGTPHQGSAWATLPPLLNLFANGDFGVGDVSDLILHTPSRPELRDIAPGSEFLISLNSRLPRHDVRYTSIIGTGSPVDESTVQAIQKTFQQLESCDGFVRLIRPRIGPLMDGFDELARGRGDGIVAANKAAMESSKDVVMVELSHFELIRPIAQTLFAEDKAHPVWDLVIDRLDGCCAPEDESDR